MPFHLNNLLLDKEFLVHALRKELPGIKAHQTMMPSGRTLLMPDDEKKVKKSAVLILIYPDEGELKLCLTKRNKKLKHHPGQISFPGGKCEPFEKYPIETALRETEEEIGIHSSEIEVLNSISALYVSVSNFIIYPIVAWTKQKPVFKINQIEVEEVIIIPLKAILSENVKTKQVVKTSQGNIEVPCYYIEENIIWGATSMMIAELEALLKQHYWHREAH